VGLSGRLVANGGTVRISEAPVGPWFATVYSSPTPLRTGEVDISVLVQDSADGTVDVPIMVEARPVGFEAEPVRRAATRGQATNKLFKAAKFDLETPGEWEFAVRVAPDRVGRIGVVSFRATVARSTILDRPYLLATLVLLPLLVLGWIWLRREDSSRESPR
jgi:hypothetical protein